MSKSSTKTEVNAGGILENFGKYQIVQYLYLCLPPIFVSMINVNYIFVAGEVSYRCRIPECETTGTYEASWWPATHTDQCSRPVLNYTIFSLQGNICSNNSFSSAVTECTEWVYENDDTIVSELNLACQPWQRSFVGVIHSFGMGIAMMIAGWLADRIGRKPTLIICAVGCVVGNLKTLATSYPVYIFLEFLEATVSGGASATSMIEIGNTENRMLAGVLFAYAIYMGEALFAIIALLVPYWKYLIHILCTPPLLFLSYIVITHESPRWLILNGKEVQAINVLKRMVKMNKINIKIEDLEKLNKNTLKQAYNISIDGKKEGLKDLFICTESLKRLVVAFVTRIAISYIYYGLVANSVWLPGNKYVYFLLGAIMSFPGELLSLYLMNKIGRKLPLVYGYTFCGLMCVAYGFVPESYRWVKITFFLAGKLIASACFTGIVTYTMELFPTSVRGTVLGLCTMAYSGGVMLGLLTPMLTSISSVLAPITFGIAAVISSALITLVPETRHLPLYDTIEQISKSVATAKDVTEMKKSKEQDNFGFTSDEPNNVVLIRSAHILASIGQGRLACFVRSLTQLCVGGVAGHAIQSTAMQLPEPPPPLAPLWDRILRARALPPDLDVQLLYIAIKDRLSHPEWEVRLHALRVLADLLPLSGNALSFPFDQVIDNLGHNSPNVRKAALDALKVFCYHCEDPECAARAIIDKFSYNNIRPHTSDVDTRINIVTGLILSIPSLISILKRRDPDLDVLPAFQILGEKLFDSMHQDVALRSLMKLRKLCGPRQYMMLFSQLDSRIQDKFRVLCEMYDEDSQDVYYAPRKTRQPIVHINRVFNNHLANPIYLSTDSSSDDSYRIPFNNNNYAKVIIETEIKFDSDTAITMTVLEQNETESEKVASDEDYDSSDRLILKYSDRDTEEDSDVVVKRVRFGGESVKIRTPDSDNINTSEEEKKMNRGRAILDKSSIKEVIPETPPLLNKMNDIKREADERENHFLNKKSGIPLPIITSKSSKSFMKQNKVKLKSKSLSELYDYFSNKNDVNSKSSGFALTLVEMRSPDKVPSPVEPHREVEVLHNLQRSPTPSPRRQQTRISLDHDRFILNLVSTTHDSNMLSPRPPSPLRRHYDWEELEIIPRHVAAQLHNTENWIAAVKAADHLHSILLDTDNVKKLESAVISFVQHMWALSDAVSAARAPAEGAVCALVRSCSANCVRQLLPALMKRLARDPPSTALPHALLQRMALHHLVELIFDPDIIGLRERLNRPMENFRTNHVGRMSQLPVPARRRARSTPAAAPPPRRLRPLPDSAPLPSISQPGRDFLLNPVSPAILIERDSSDIGAPQEPIEKLELEEIEKNIENIADDHIDKDIEDNTDIENKTDEVDHVSVSRTPSIHVEDLTENNNQSIPSAEPSVEQISIQSDNTSPKEEVGQDAKISESVDASEDKRSSEKSSPLSNRSKSTKSIASTRSGNSSPDPTSEPIESKALERDVRTALAECIVPQRHEDWEVIVNGLLETERLANDVSARAPAASWRAVTRSVALHVRSLRSRVARAACSTLGTLFEQRGRALDPEMEEATSALLERCADVNRFLRADAITALGRVACGGGCARAGVALARRGANHRAGPVRAAAAQALTRLVRHHSAVRVLELPSEPRTVILRAAGELLADASPEARLHARHLCIALSEDVRFRQMLKDAMPLTRYRAIVKYVDKLRCR
ncbi:unnamed protein product, partial [Brenthis ino]